LVVLAAACGTSATPATLSETEHPVVETAPLSATATASNAPADERCASPLRIGVLLDKSGSTRENVVPQMTEGELEDLIRLVNTCAGGEVAVGVLCDVSGDKPFARLYLPARAPAPDEVAPLPVSDPFTEIQRAQAAARAAGLRRKAEKAEAAARGEQIQRFRKEALTLLQAPVSCARTDVLAGANRLLTYLDEPWPAAVAGPVRVGVYVTDGADTARRQTLRDDPDLAATHLLVGGSRDAGVLAPLNPVRFESVEAALRWIRSAAEASFRPELASAR
jgi:hypothetical protein